MLTFSLAIALCLAAAPNATAPLRPSESFLDLELCGPRVGGTCSVRDLAVLGLASVRWQRLPGRELWPGRWSPGWRLEGVRQGKVFAFELHRYCTAFDGANRPFAYIEGWTLDGKSEKTIPDLDDARDIPLHRLLKRVRALHPKQGRSGRASASAVGRAEPPDALLDLELCAHFVDGRSCTVRQFAAAVPLGKQWVHFEENARDPARRGPTAWRLVVDARPDTPGDDETLIELVPGCAWGWPAAEVTTYRNGYKVRPSFLNWMLKLLDNLVSGVQPSWPPEE